MQNKKTKRNRLRIKSEAGASFVKVGSSSQNTNSREYNEHDRFLRNKTNTFGTL